MHREVLVCSMFHVPDFIDGLEAAQFTMFKKNLPAEYV